MTFKKQGDGLVDGIRVIRELTEHERTMDRGTRYLLRVIPFIETMIFLFIFSFIVFPVEFLGAWAKYGLIGTAGLCFWFCRATTLAFLIAATRDVLAKEK